MIKRSVSPSKDLSDKVPTASSITVGIPLENITFLKNIPVVWVIGIFLNLNKSSLSYVPESIFFEIKVPSILSSTKRCTFDSYIT